MPRRKAAKRAVVVVPKSREEAARFIAEIGAAKRAIEREEGLLAQRIDRLKERSREVVAPSEKRIAELFSGLYAFAEAHRKELTEDGKRKTAVFPTGELGWRFTPPAVSIRGVEKVLEQLKTLGLNRFIRTKEEIDRDAMLRESDTAGKLKGVTIKKREEFFVKPVAVKLGIAVEINRLKKEVGV
jgi:phage host-nuclease inhibitor protein Gam